MIRPIGDKIVVKPLSSNISCALHVPDFYLTSEAYGEVVAIGTYYLTPGGKKLLTEEHPNAWPVKIGDKITFSAVPGIAKELTDDDGEKILLMHIGQVRTIIEE